MKKLIFVLFFIPFNLFAGPYYAVSGGSSSASGEVLTDYNYCGPMTSDTAATDCSYIGANAYSQAATNKNGGDLYAVGGIQTQYYTMVKNSLGAVTVTTTVTGVSVALASTTDFALGSDDTATQLAVTATNLATAINANATLSPKMTATASTVYVYLTPKVGVARIIGIATSVAARIAVTTGTQGDTVVKSFKIYQPGATTYSKVTSPLVGSIAMSNAASDRGWCITANTSYDNSMAIFGGKDCSTVGNIMMGTTSWQATPASGNAYSFSVQPTANSNTGKVVIKAKETIFGDTPSGKPRFQLYEGADYVCAAGAGVPVCNVGILTGALGQANDVIVPGTAFTCSDTDGCQARLGTANAVANQWFNIFNNSANLTSILEESGAGYCSKVSGPVAGIPTAGTTLAMTRYSTATFIYDAVGTCWVEVSAVIR
jgi:hypothetical protein